MRVDVPVEIAIGGTVDRPALATAGWLLADPLDVARDAWTFQSYIQCSRGEFAVAKHGYATSGCGWFSERSANYLASGRPVVTQETGFTHHLPAGDGLLSFTTIDEAVNALETVERSYKQHARSAREIAREFFDSGLVLSELLDRLP
jgi:hypothetical protein